jgi:tetratricopeptide (TPR) repeat protein
MRIIIIGLLLWSSPLFLGAQDLHDPAELLEILEKSTFNYSLQPLEEPIEAEKDIALNSNVFYRKTEGNGFATVEVVLTEKAEVLKEEAEGLFQNKKYEAARLLYDQLLQLHPEYSKLLVYIGQTYHLEGEVYKAIPFYKRAIEQNFIDYMAHWFLGRAMLDEGKLQECIAPYLTAHLLNRNHPLLLEEMTKILEINGLEYQNWQFVPQIALERKDSIDIKVAFGEGWMGYALAKAVWKFEPSHSEEMQETFGQPSIAQEKEALMALYLVDEVGEKKLSKEPFLMAFKEALENGAVESYILYEIFLLEHPFIAYQLTSDHFMELGEYIITSHCSVIKGNKKSKKKKKKKTRKKRKQR